MSGDDQIAPADVAAVARASAAAASARTSWTAPLRRLVARITRRTSDPWTVRPSRSLRRALLRSGLFDPQTYAADADLAQAGDPPSHFLTHGFAEHRRPNLLFDPLWYLGQNPDVLREGVNPLLHYASTGEAEGRRPHPLFDPQWYARAYPDVDGRRGLLRHYLHHGRDEGRSPSAEFDPRLYLKANPDLPDLGPDTLRHYLDHGIPERRALRPPPAPEPAVAGPEEVRLAYKLQADGLPRYTIEAGPAAYTYVPPPKPADLTEQMKALDDRPRFSIVTPVYNVAPALLEACVGSVVQQWWPDWELILVDDCSPKAATRAYLRELSHPQIKVEFSHRNEGISGATNRALALATGDYVVFLDNDDELTPDCLWELAQRIAATNADYVYSDEDKLSPEGGYVDPFFKPDWSPDAFMSIMYTCHVSCLRRSLIDEVGHLRSDFNGAQDYDLVLRAIENTEKIEHVAKVLYHWRILPTSVAASIDAKPYAVAAVKRAKEEALRRRGLDGDVEAVPQMPGQFRIRHRAKGAPTISVIIPSKNNGAVLERCVESIRALTNYPDYEIILVDNGSNEVTTRSYLQALALEQGATILSEPGVFNFSAINNLAAEAARGDHLLFLNDDTEVLQADWLDRLVGWSALPHIGAVGAKLLFPDGLVQHCGVVTLGHGPGHAFYRTDPDAPLAFGRNLLEYDWSAVTAACMMVERSKFTRVSGFDAQFAVAYNDVDLCYRLNDAGYHNVVCQAVRLIHHESVSRGQDHEHPEKTARMLRERRRLNANHPARLCADPYSNPNLQLDSPNFEPAFL